MANNPNDPDFQKNNEELNRFNDSLKESIDLSRSLSRNIKSVTDELKLSKGANSELYNDLGRYNDALSKTIGLSKKLADGRLKVKDVEKSIAEIGQTYADYMARNNKSFEARGRFTLRQKNLQAELLKLEDEEIDRRLRIGDADTKIDNLRQQLAAAEARRRAATDTAVKNTETQAIRAIQAKIKNQTDNIRILEKEQSKEAKISAQKQQTLDKVEDIIKSHKGLQKQYEDEIKKNEILLKLAQEQDTVTNRISNTYKDISKLLNPFTAIFAFIKQMAFAISEQTVKIQRGLVKTYDEALAIRQEFNAIAVASGDVAVTAGRIVTANAELGKQLGYNTQFSEDMNTEFIKLTKTLGLSNESAGGLAKLTKISGQEFKDVKSTIYQTTQQLSVQNGLQQDQVEVMDEVGKISGQTLAMLKGNPKALTEAVVQARLLGTTLESTKKSAAALLDFESSIENELQAELITGRQFNLERARAAALTGDLTTEMKELANQGIDFNNYSQMNVVAQQKIADMMGKTTDELTDQLLKQQYLGMSHEQIVSMSGEEVAKRVEALNAQEQFNLAMEKMQDIVTQLVGGELGQLVQTMASALTSAEGLYSMILAIAGVSLGKTLASLAAIAIELELSAAGAIATASAISFGLAAIGIVAGIAAMMGAFDNAKNEAVQPTSAGDMYSAKGKTIVSPKEGGLFSLSDNDEFAAAPGLGDMINRPQQTSATVVQDNSSLLNEMKELNRNTILTNQGIAQLYSKNTNIYMGPNKVGQLLTQNNYNLA
jgi:hypothetical protein